MDYFDTKLNSMIANDDTPFFDHVRKIQFSGDNAYTVIYEEDSANTYSSDDVYFALLGGKKQPLGTAKVESYLWSISSMQPTYYVSYNADEEDLRSYGLDDPDLTVTVDYTTEDEDGNEEQKTFVLHISQDPEAKKAAEEAGEHDAENSEEYTAYVRIGESKIIYEISSDRYKGLMAAFYDDLRHPKVLWADFADVRQIDISLEGSSYTILSETDGDDRTYTYQGEKLEIDDFKDALEALTAEEFTSERPTQKKEIGLTIYLDNEHFPEVQIELYRYDGTYCLALANGESVSFVERSSVVQLMEAVRTIVLK